MGAIVPDRAVRVCGADGAGVTGTVTVRVFETCCELLYRARPVTETEKLNAWLAEAGGSRVRSAYPPTYGGVGLPDNTPEPTPEDNKERADRRARQRVRWSSKAIQADRLLTLTHRANVTDFAESRRMVERFRDMCRRRWPNWKYVAVPERQERGAWHWHFAVPGWLPVHTLRAFWWRAHGLRVEVDADGKPRLPAGVESPGNVDIKAAKKHRRGHGKWDVSRLAAYLAKYIGKSLDALELEGRARYLCSRGIEWRETRFYMRALTFEDVASGLFEVAALVGAVNVPYWTAPDRRTIWAAATLGAAPAGPPQANSS